MFAPLLLQLIAIALCVSIITTADEHTNDAIMKPTSTEIPARYHCLINFKNFFSGNLGWIEYEMETCKSYIKSFVSRKDPLDVRINREDRSMMDSIYGIASKTGIDIQREEDTENLLSYLYQRYPIATKTFGISAICVIKRIYDNKDVFDFIVYLTECLGQTAKLSVFGAILDSKGRKYKAEEFVNEEYIEYKFDY